MTQQHITYSPTGRYEGTGRVAGYHVYADEQPIGTVAKAGRGGWFAQPTDRTRPRTLATFRTRTQAGEWLGRQALPEVMA